MSQIGISLSGQIDDPITEINCGDSIPKFGGNINISLFPELTGFYCTGHDITTISDLSKNTKLKKIDISYNQLTEIPSKLSDNIYLEYINFSNNKINSLSGNFLPQNIIYFDGSNNNLSATAVTNTIDYIYNNGKTGGYLNLSGGNNEPPSSNVILYPISGSLFQKNSAYVTVTDQNLGVTNNSIITVTNVLGSEKFNGTYLVTNVGLNSFQYYVYDDPIGSQQGSGLAYIYYEQGLGTFKKHQILSLPQNIYSNGRAWNINIPLNNVERIGNNLTGNVINSFFGSQVGINGAGDRVVIGNPNWTGTITINVNGVDQSQTGEYGKIEIYDLESGSWKVRGLDQFTALFAPRNAKYGRSVAMSENGNTIAVGSLFLNDEFPDNRGSIEILTYDDMGWSVPFWLEGDNQNDLFGSDLALSSDGTVLAASAPAYDNNRGVVKIYKIIGDNPFLLGSPIVGEQEDINFGRKIALSKDGKRIAITDDFGVKVYEYKIVAPNIDAWEEIGNNTIFYSAPLATDYSLSLNEDGVILAIGSFSNNYLGSVKIVKEQGGSWSTLGNIISGYASNSSKTFGNAVSLSNDGNYLQVGDSGAYNNFGVVRNFKYDSTISQWKEITYQVSAQDLLSSGFGADIASSSNGKYFIAGCPNSNFASVYNVKSI